MDEKKSTDILSGDNKAPLVIFKTEEDKTGVNILKMSNLRLFQVLCKHKKLI